VLLADNPAMDFKKSRIHADVVNSTTEAVVRTLSNSGLSITHIRPARKVLSLPGRPATCAAFTCMGGVDTEVCWSFDSGVVDKLASVFFPNVYASAQMESIPHEDTVGEIANILIGLAVGFLEDLGVRVSVSTPKVLSAKDAPIVLPEPAVEILVELPEGAVRVIVGGRIVSRPTPPNAG
jgi:CheY-specific phosphatase CheX